MSSEENVAEKFRHFIEEAFNSEKAMKAKDISQDDIDTLREMSLSSDFIPKALLDKVYLLILITCDNDKDKSLNLLHNYCKLKKETPEFFAKRDVMSDEIQQALNNQIYAVLPPTPSSCNLILHKLSTYEPKNYVFDAAEKVFLMTIEACLIKEGPKNGVIFLWDMEGGQIGHVFQPKISSIRKLIKLVDEACPFKIQEIHVLNTQPFLDLVLALFKPFMKSDILSRIRFYSKNINYEKFYKESLPKHCLPSDYGGLLPSIKELHEKNREYLVQMREYFLLEERLMNFEFEDCDFDGHNKK